MIRGPKAEKKIVDCGNDAVSVGIELISGCAQVRRGHGRHPRHEEDVIGSSDPDQRRESTYHARHTLTRHQGRNDAVATRIGDLGLKDRYERKRAARAGNRIVENFVLAHREASSPD